MKTSSKIKLGLLFLLIAGIIAYVIALCFKTEKVVAITDTFIRWLNTPIGIAGGTTITLGLVAGVLIKLVYDRKKKDIGSMLNEQKNFFYQKQKEFESEKLKVEQKECDIREYLSNYSERIDILTELLVKVCETSPNAKIKAIGKEIANKDKEQKNKLSENLEVLKDIKETEYKSLIERFSVLEERLKDYEREEGKERTNN